VFRAKEEKREREEVENLDMHGRISQLFLINALTCGLEVCLAAGTIYIPPMLLEAGVEERFMTMVLGKGLKKRSLSLSKWFLKVQWYQQTIHFLTFPT